ncbi:PAS domain S-box protein [Paenibacillus oralis]|uniref:PAS domain S-box protein n=1 Tax=Paenibacillus oralis TaxID=2490856 RepID=A0A3P3U218_9BACL|nr:sigma 54-interacting transcriptional regulator [Paenibacillus oralis]RRJ62613.1 PAS domain S-box protein [Paenibacillus oralis]
MFNVERERLIRRDFLELKPEEKVSALLAALRQGKVAITAAGDGGVCLLAPRDASLLEGVTGRIGEYLAAHGAAFAAVVVREEELSVSGPVHELIAKLPETGSRAAIVVADEEGRPTGYCPFSEMLLAAGEAERQTLAYFRTLLETVSDAVTVVDRNGTVVGWNLVAEEVYGIAKEDIVGRTIGEHFDPEALVVLKILDEGRRLQGAYHRPRPDTHVLINASPIVAEGGGEIIGGVATEQDITHLVKLNDELGAAQSRLLTHKMSDRDPFALLHARGESMGKVVKIAKKIAETDSPVLFIGETGAGKEQLAKVIHQASRRSEGPFLSISCGAIPVGLAEAELFGYQGGAFSGRPSGQAGKLEAADGGSLFLNEIDRLSPDVQDKLCRFMKSRAVARIGGGEETAVSSRIFAATAQDLERLVQEGKFRADLYYALNIVALKVPPLRERKEDLSTLIQTYLRTFSLQYQKPVPAVAPEVMLAFMNYDWPGNQTELRAVMERCVILSENDRITLEHLPGALQQRQAQLELDGEGGGGEGLSASGRVMGAHSASNRAVEAHSASGQAGGQGMEKSGGSGLEPSARMLKPRITPEEEIELMKEALERAAGNKSNAAKLLGISRGTLYKKIRDYNLV